MKKITILALTILMGSFAFGQNDKVLDHNNVTTAVLKEVFENAYMEVPGTDEKYLIVKDQFTLFVTLYDQNKRYIEYVLFNGLKDDASDMDKLMLANTINKELIEVSAYIDFDKNQIVFKYDLWIEGGVTPSDIIKSFKGFQNTLSASVVRDRQHILK